MTTRDLLASNRGYAAPLRPGARFLTEDTWRNNPASNPGLLPANADYDVLTQNELERELADQVMKKSQANEARRKIAFLRSLGSNPNINVFQTPTNPQDEELARIIQEHMDAGTRGWNISVGDAKRREAEYYKNLDTALKVRAANRQDYRAGLENERLLQSLEQADRQYGLNQEKNQIGWDRNDIRFAGLSQSEVNRDYMQALSDLDYDVPVDRVLQNYTLTPAQKQRLIDVSKARASGQSQEYAGLQAQSGTYNQALQRATDMAAADFDRRNTGTGLFGTGLFASSPDATKRAAAVEAARQKVMQQFAKDTKARGQILYDPAVDAFSPIAENPNPNVATSGPSGRQGGGNLPFVSTLEQLRQYRPGTRVMTPGGMRIVPQNNFQAPRPAPRPVRGPYDWQQDIYTS